MQNAEDAQKCVDESLKFSLQLDGRHLDAIIAVTKENIDKQKSEQKTENNDKRNLFLAREGCKFKLFLFNIRRHIFKINK